MIPITEDYPVAPLSFERTTKILQDLTDQRDTLYLPDEIKEAMKDVIEAQKKFVQNIDDYLHCTNTYDHLQNKDAVKAMIETCPELLTTKGMCSRILPIDNATYSREVEVIVTLIEELGMQYAIDGIECVEP